MAKRRYGITEARIERYSKEGRGEGRLAEYRPWLRIQDVPSNGLSSRLTGTVTGRLHHLLSTGERDVFLDCDWHTSVTDLREQFPLDRHETIAISQEMGVCHPRDRGVDIVMTTDLLVDHVVRGEPRQSALSVKPAVDLEDGKTVEKLEIERRFWKRRGVPFHVLTEAERSKDRAFNLLELAERRTLEHLEVPREDYWEDVCQGVLEGLRRRPEGTLAHVLAALETQCGWAVGDGLAALRHLAANRRVWLDVEVPFDPRGAVSQIRVGDATASKVA
jgi:hypothetical protein